MSERTRYCGRTRNRCFLAAGACQLGQFRSNLTSERTSGANTVDRLRADHGVSISGLVVEYIVAVDVTRVRFPADAMVFMHCQHANNTSMPAQHSHCSKDGHTGI